MQLQPSMNNKSNTVALVALGIAIIALILSFTGGTDTRALGSTGTRFPNGLSADSTSPAAGELRGADLTLTDDATITDDLTVNGGTFTLTTSNTATSSAVIGCMQFYATSTATAGHLEFNTQSTTTINGASAGTVAWKYGGCPV